MIDVAMAGGDFVVSAEGDLMLDINDDYDIIQMANNTINTILTENIFHQDLGNNAWNKRLKIAESGFTVVQDDSKAAILHADHRVAEVLSIVASKGDNYGECSIKYTLMTVDGRTISSSTSINIF